MEIRLLTSDDQPALERFLLPRVSSGMFLLGNSRTAGIGLSDEQYSGVYAAEMRGDDVRGVFAKFKGGRSSVLADTDVDEPVNISALVQLAQENNLAPLTSIAGPFDQVELALAAVPDRGEPALKSREILFSLDVEDLVIPANLTEKDCSYRTIPPADLDPITDWRIDFKATSLNMSPSTISREKTRDEILSQRWWILEAEGRPVSMTTFNCLIAEAAVVGSVYTPPDLRGKGYARAVVAGSILDAQKEGVARVILFTGEENFPAQRAYRSLGFRECGDFGLVVWG